MKETGKYVPCECPKCGKLFTCTGDVNCWCMEIKIPGKVKDYISARFEGCLCKECILKLIEEFE